MKTVLIVDDEYPIALTLHMILEDEGYRAPLAANGHEALQLMAQQLPDLVITDLMMPIMNGLELARKIHEDNNLHSTKVILMSAVKEPAKDAEYHGFLKKPFDLDTVLAMVEEQIGPPSD